MVLVCGRTKKELQVNERTPGSCHIPNKLLLDKCLYQLKASPVKQVIVGGRGDVFVRRHNCENESTK